MKFYIIYDATEIIASFKSLGEAYAYFGTMKSHEGYEIVKVIAVGE